MTHPYDPPPKTPKPGENTSHGNAVINVLVVIGVVVFIGLIVAVYYFYVFNKPLSTYDAVVYLHSGSNPENGPSQVGGNIVGDTEEKTFDVDDQLKPEHIDPFVGCSRITVESHLRGNDVIVAIVPLSKLDASRQCTVPLSEPRD